MKNKRTIHPGTGLSTILLIFVVLSMTILSLFTYMRVQQDHQSLQREYQQKQGYYQAQALANYIYQEIQEGVMIQTLENKTQVKIDENKQTIQFEIPISDQQVLSVSFKETGDILKWQVQRGE